MVRTTVDSVWFPSSIYDIRRSTKKKKLNQISFYNVRIARVHISIYVRLGMHLH